MEAVGYEMYISFCPKLWLNSAAYHPKAKRMQNRHQGDAHIPESYIEPLSQRLDVIQKNRGSRERKIGTDVIDELIDRFGDPPPAVSSLLQIAMYETVPGYWYL
jgi:transcription-repair coupling factor (superfamily II helicase)